MTLAPVLTGCHVCRDPRVETINGWIKAGVTLTEVERRLKEGGDGYSRITLSKHKNRHLISAHDKARKEAAAAMERQQRTIKGPTNLDLATLVHDNVAQRVHDGELEPTISDGLRARAMLDARAEKGADRDLLLQLAQVLGGATPLVIEGEYREIDDEALEDGAMFAGLLGAG